MVRGAYQYWKRVSLKVRSTRGSKNHEKHRHDGSRQHSTVVLTLLGAQAHAGGSADSVVKVFSQMRLPNPVRPWIKQNPIEVMGSGVVIERNRILTNAHLVLYADEIFVQGGQGGDRVEAKVAAIGPGIDLAVLTLEDETFFAKRPPIARAAKLPEITSRVAVQGFPIGGNSLSTTQGTVARIEYDFSRPARPACGSRSTPRSTRATAVGRPSSTAR